MHDSDFHHEWALPIKFHFVIPYHFADKYWFFWTYIKHIHSSLGPWPNMDIRIFYIYSKIYRYILYSAQYFRRAHINSVCMILSG